MFNTDVFSYKDYLDSASHNNEEIKKIFSGLTFFLLRFFSSLMLYFTQQDRIILSRFGTFLMACQK